MMAKVPGEQLTGGAENALLGKSKLDLPKMPKSTPNIEADAP